MKKSIRFESGLTRLRSRRLVPAIAAIGGACGLAATPAGALELGDIQVESKLGQPLRASIAYALGPNEQLYDFCIYLRPGPPSEGIPSVARARVSLSEGAIVLSGNVAVKEPLLNVRIAVNCPYSPRIQREYTLMVSPGDFATAPPQPVFVETRQVTPVSRPEPVTAEVPADQPVRTLIPSPVADDSPIAIGSTYRVLIGDTASAIASRITDRGVGLWPATFGIVDANPDAFVDGDVNKLIAGSLLVIPDFNAEPVASAVVEPAVTEAVEPAVVETIEAPIETARASEPATSANIAETPSESAAAPVVEPFVDPAEPVIDDAAEPISPVAENSSPFIGSETPAEETAGLGLTITATEEMRPGDVFVPPAPQTAAPANSEIAPIEDAEIPQVAGSTETAASGAWAWLFWLFGAGLAILLAVLTFGGKFRDRLRAVGTAAAGKLTRESDEKPTPEAPAGEDLDISFDDLTSPREMALDADFDDGSGLSDSAEIDVLQDFGFAAESQSTGKLDFEITEDLAREPVDDPTDIIAPSHRIDESSILDVEVPPGELTGEHTGDYDMSMIVDATKQPIGNYDRTAQDLQAVRVDDDEYKIEDQTLTDEVELKVLEQDYEEELSATQALNLEIERAARELAERMDEDSLAGTLEQPMVDMTEAESIEEDLLDDGTLEVAASDKTGINRIVDMPSVSDSGITAELTGRLPINIEAENDPSASDTGSRETIEIAAAGSDVTIELQVETGKFDTKKIKKKRRK